MRKGFQILAGDLMFLVLSIPANRKFPYESTSKHGEEVPDVHRHDRKHTVDIISHDTHRSQTMHSQ